MEPNPKGLEIGKQYLVRYNKTTSKYPWSKVTITRFTDAGYPWTNDGGYINAEHYDILPLTIEADLKYKASEFLEKNGLQALSTDDVFTSLLVNFHISVKDLFQESDYL